MREREWGERESEKGREGERKRGGGESEGRDREKVREGEKSHNEGWSTMENPTIKVGVPWKIPQ